MSTVSLDLLEETRQRHMRFRDEAKARRSVAQEKVDNENAAMSDRSRSIEDLNNAIAALTYSTNGDQT
jgi:hypothetical protein